MGRSGIRPCRDLFGCEDLTDDGGAGNRGVAQRIEINLGDATGLAITVEVERATEEITEIGADEGNANASTGGEILLVEKGDGSAVTGEFAPRKNLAASEGGVEVGFGDQRVCAEWLGEAKNGFARNRDASLAAGGDVSRTRANGNS